MTFGDLRSLLHAAPSVELWAQFCAHIERLRQEPGFEEQVLPYAHHQLASWPDTLRRAPEAWFGELLDRGRSPLLPLARYVKAPQLSLDDATIADVLLAPELAEVRGLDLSVNFLKTKATELLSESPIFGQLEELELERNSLEHLRGLLAHRSAPRLRKLGLRGNFFRDRGALDLAAHVEALPGLRELNLDSTKVSDLGLLGLLDRGRLESLEVLELGNNAISHIGRLKAWHLPKITELGLRWSRLNEQELGKLLDGGLASRLRRLDISSNSRIGHNERSVLCDVDCEALESLDVHACFDNNAWIVGILGHAGLGALRELVFTASPFNVAIAEALCESPYAHRLERLVLYGAAPSEQFWDVFAQATMPALRSLELGYHGNLSDDALRVLIAGEGFSREMRQHWLDKRRRTPRS